MMLQRWLLCTVTITVYPLVDEDQEIMIRPVPAMMVDDNAQRMKEMTAILEDRVNCKYRV